MTIGLGSGSAGWLEAAPDAIVVVDGDGRVVLVNAQAERLFGYTRQELLGEPVEILVPQGMRAAHPSHRRRYLTDPRPRPMGAGVELAARRKDGTEFPAEISLSALQTEDGLIVSAAIRDVTERLQAQTARERLEAELRQAQRLESLGQLAGGVAHDFNNLLAVMLNYTDLVAERVEQAAAADPAADWQSVSADLTQIRRAGQRATELTHQLLAFGRREVIQPQVLDLNQIEAEVEQLLHRTLGEHIQLTADLAAGLWPVFADPGQMEQVLLNLAVNARDAMPAGGTLTIATRNLPRREAAKRPALAPGRYVTLAVADTGTGIAPEVLDRVFEPFFTTKPKGHGTGLGLATIYGIITQAGGHATITSVPAAGTSFTAILPATDQTPTPPDPAATSRGAYRHHGETILLVEDEDALREVTRRLLTRNGYHIITAASGAEALKLAEHCHWRIDLLLTDVIMPHMLGKELVTRLREKLPGLPVLYMSGYAQPVLASQGTLDPGVTLIQKPFDQADLLANVRTVLDNFRTQTPT